MKKNIKEFDSYAEDLIMKAYKKHTETSYLIGEAWIEINWVKPSEVAYGIRKVGHGPGLIYAIYIAHFEQRESKIYGRKYFVARTLVEKNKLFYGEDGLNMLRKYILFLKS